MREKLTVIKVGGKIVEEEATLHKLLDDFAATKSWYTEVAVRPQNWLPDWALKARW